MASGGMITKLMAILGRKPVDKSKLYSNAIERVHVHF
jgi:hypothetical protein